MHTLRGLGKTEQLAREMKRYHLSILAVTETHLPGEREMVLEQESRYTLNSRRHDKCTMEGVGLALTPHASATMRYHQAVSSRVLAVEFLTNTCHMTVLHYYGFL